MSNCSASWASVRSPAMAARATFALKAGVWFRRGRRCMVSPDLQVTACPPSGRNSTYRLVQISGASSDRKAAPGSVVVDTAGPLVYYVLPEAKAIRYGATVGEAG